MKLILALVGAGMLIGVLALFFVNGGGFQGVADRAQHITSVRDYLLGSGTSFMLPGQDRALANLGISSDTLNSGTTNAAPSPASTHMRPSMQSGDTAAESGSVSLAAWNATAANPAEEYVTITAASTNSGPIDISGWSLQSLYSGTRVYLPLAASPFILGVVNRVSDAVLMPGESALYTSGISPIGVSFRETICTGYLNQMQPFTPALSNSCPTSESVVPATDQNIAAYGASCFDFLRTIPPCDYPRHVPATLTAACRALIASAFSYNGCVQQFQSASNFALPTYRLFGNYTQKLWGREHDVIRLLDKNARIIDAVSY